MDGKGAGNRIAILLQGQADGKREGDPCRRSHIPVECCGVQAGAGYRKIAAAGRMGNVSAGYR